jgi:hypothetical protein
MRMHSTIMLVGLTTLAALGAGCSQDPAAPLHSHPADVAYSDPHAIPRTPRSSTGTPVKANIVLAQIGHAIGSDGTIISPQEQIPLDAPIYGVALFEGEGGDSARVELRVYDVHERQVGGGIKDFAAQGRALVTWEVKSSSTRWAPGAYRALFLCESGPCWEIKFTHR